MCGVQGGSTAQRCAFSTLSAHLFCLDAFGGRERTFARTVVDAVAYAADVCAPNTAAVATSRRKFDNVSDVPFVKLAEGRLRYSARSI